MPNPRLKKIVAVTGLFSGVVLSLWFFPDVWYQNAKMDSAMFWLKEQDAAPGSKFVEVPVSESAERVLVADQTVNGEIITGDQQSIRVFSAKRFEEKRNEIGLFMHTPDRCWTQAGWKLEPAAPDVVELDVHGVKILVERRVFVTRGHRELVYFFGLVGGRPLPYRLDHNLSVGQRFHRLEHVDESGTAARATDKHFWARLFDSFQSRRELFGPKQFIRISTAVNGDDFAAADARLTEFIPKWLTPGDYLEERGAWARRVIEREDKSRGS